MLLALAAADAPGQAAPQEPPRNAGPPVLRAAFAAGVGPSALLWLRREVLARRPEWPAGRDPGAAFSLQLSLRGLRFGPAAGLPAGVAVAGDCQLPGGSSVLFACDGDGREQWECEGGPLPPDLAEVTAALHVAIGDPPRVVDLAALVGNLAGPAVHGDPAADMLALGSTYCGDVTFAVRRQGNTTTVHGASAGGLTLPALLVWLSLRRDGARVVTGADDRWRLRAFGSRDGDRAEAARQLLRAGGDGVPTLRALLHADEPSRLAAIDGLLRMHAAAELPHIVAAADPELPLATSMAVAAVRELWPMASAPTRAAVRSVVARNGFLQAELRAAVPAASARYRALAILGVFAAGLLGLWLRERHLRLRAS